MSSPTFSMHSSQSSDREVWGSLKQAIAGSSGFKQWQQESDNKSEDSLTTAELEGQVRGYLRETLETLAY